MIDSKLLFYEISDKDIERKTLIPYNASYRILRSARGVLRKKTYIALIYAGVEKYHKLPGGGAVEAERIENTFKREILEETGCKCLIAEGSGVTIEYRYKHKLMQISYVFLADVWGESVEPMFSKSEIDSGFKVKWVTLDQAVAFIKADNPSTYIRKFINVRDLKILQYYQEKFKHPMKSPSRLRNNADIYN